MDTPPPERWEAQVRRLARSFTYPPTPRLKPRRPQAVAPISLLRRGVMVLVLLCVVSFATVPPLRAGLWQWVQIGGARIGLLPTAATPMIPVVLPPLPGSAVSTTQVEKVLGQELRLPTELGAPNTIQLLSADDKALLVYWTGPPAISLYRFEGGFWTEKWTQQDNLTWTNVNFHPAAWVPGPYLWAMDQSILANEQVVTASEGTLIWAEDDITYRLQGEFTLEEAVTIAESLSP